LIILTRVCVAFMKLLCVQSMDIVYQYVADSGSVMFIRYKVSAGLAISE